MDFFYNQPKDNYNFDIDLISLVTELFCHALKNKHLNKDYQFSCTRSSP